DASFAQHLRHELGRPTFGAEYEHFPSVRQHSGDETRLLDESKVGNVQRLNQTAPLDLPRCVFVVVADVEEQKRRARIGLLEQPLDGGCMFSVHRMILTVLRSVFHPGRRIQIKSETRAREASPMNATTPPSSIPSKSSSLSIPMTSMDMVQPIIRTPSSRASAINSSSDATCCCFIIVRSMAAPMPK